MDIRDLFKPYSPKIRGDLGEYLREHDGRSADNLFYGPKYFFIIKNKGWMVPNMTHIRVDQSPIPDISYFINSDYLLESRGHGHQNMSLMGAKKGVYDPKKALKNQKWSISWLKLRHKPAPNF